MAATTTTQVPSGVQVYYDRLLLMRAVPYFAYNVFGQKRPLPKGNSKSIKFRRYGNLTAATSALTEGVTPAGSQLSVTDITASVSQYGDFVTLSDFIDMTVEDRVATETVEIQGDQYGDTIDQITRDVVAAGTAVRYSSADANRAAVAHKLLAADLDIVIRALETNNAKYFTFDKAKPYTIQVLCIHINHFKKICT